MDDVATHGRAAGDCLCTTTVVVRKVGRKLWPYNSFQPLRVPTEERGIPETVRRCTCRRLAWQR